MVSLRPPVIVANLPDHTAGQHGLTVRAYSGHFRIPIIIGGEVAQQLLALRYNTSWTLEAGAIRANDRMTKQRTPH